MSMNFVVYGTWMGWSPSSDRVILAVSECFADQEYLPLSAPSSFDPRTSTHLAPAKKLCGDWHGLADGCTNQYFWPQNLREKRHTHAYTASKLWVWSLFFVPKKCPTVPL